MGQLPDNEKKENAGAFNSEEWGLSLREALRTRQFWVICGVFQASLFCIGTIVMHIVPHAIDLGISQASAARVLSTVGGASIAGRFVMGGASDRIGEKVSIMICFGFLISALLCLQLANVILSGMLVSVLGRDWVCF